ncbi:Periplasmic ferric-dicitrate binding protein FerR [Proteiniphilum saccharofermentans]|uniref:Periplasmic ferric-dicitrate binding protein FerR n=1 Tax=Proteiniphilum saccharofermentans TaxID=1642647 RepID=A0A1R3SYL6_9BACT|nr:FecR family protein [Proteiniphilum saccharofermentans]SCD21283.1 Periplasmic ferric-dicitrate binding protein FerR [Proteiniphilum saccharofermentans]SFS93782.1 FecR family protein [Porphyromonadaceae bacterium NLAE-zl-C104]
MDDLLKKYLEGDTNRIENRDVFEWIRQSDKNEQKFKALRRLHDIAIWRDDAVVGPVVREKVQKRNVSVFIRIAAACILAMALFYFYQQVSDSDTEWIVGQSDAGMQEMSVPTGQNAELVLDDGTNVWLNSKSTLVFPSRFTGTERVVQLSGEGYFDVAHDSGRPFKVETQQYSIEVLGTEFNVRAYEGSQLFETSLLKGSVIVRSVQTSEDLYLKPNERAIGKDSKLNITSFNKDEFLWREGILFIDDKSIYEILPVLEQYFDTKFIIEENSVEKHKKYTGKFRIQDGVEHILNVLQIQNKFSYKMYQEDKTIIIK